MNNFTSAEPFDYGSHEDLLKTTLKRMAEYGPVVTIIRAGSYVFSGIRSIFPKDDSPNWYSGISVIHDVKLPRTEYELEYSDGTAARFDLRKGRIKIFPKDVLDQELEPVLSRFKGSKLTPATLSKIYSTVSNVFLGVCTKFGITDSPSFLAFIYQKDNHGRVVPGSPPVSELPEAALIWAAEVSGMEVKDYQEFLKGCTFDLSIPEMSIQVIIEYPPEWKPIPELSFLGTESGRYPDPRDQPIERGRGGPAGCTQKEWDAGIDDLKSSGATCG